MKPISSALLALVLAFTGHPALLAADPTGSDLAKEQRWREQIVDTLMDGEAVDLQAGELTFLGIYTESLSETGEPSKRGAIVVHGIGIHPDWPQVVNPLRVTLPEHGWSTLAIQAPVLANEAESADYLPLLDGVAPRMDAAIAFLKEQGIEHIAIVAHSLGATMSGDYLSNHSDAVDAYVAIGMSGGAPQARLDNVQILSRISTPTLDLYGQHDLEAVVSSAPDRVKSALAAGNSGFSQVQVPGANHFFDDQNEALVDTVLQWLDQTVPGT